MKTQYVFSFLLLTTLRLPAQAQTDSVAARQPVVYSVVERHPEFPGGMNKLGKYFRQNLRYPERARQARIKGTVFVNFVVTDQGAIEDVKVLKGLGFGTDEEAVRLIKEMPRWIPGRQGEKPVYCRFNLPINFE